MDVYQDGFKTEAQIGDAYRHIAKEVWQEELSVERGRSCIREWWEQEEKATWWLGYPDWPDRPTMIFIVEAGRALAGMNKQSAKELLEMAIESLD